MVESRDLICANSQRDIDAGRAEWIPYEGEQYGPETLYGWVRYFPIPGTTTRAPAIGGDYAVTSAYQDTPQGRLPR